MNIYNYLPTYHQIEANNLKGLQPGFVISQMDIAADATEALLTADGKFENGRICGISKDGIVAAGSDTKVLFINFTEPLNTIAPNLSWKYYAVDPSEECPRLVQLIPGDEWMSDLEPSIVCVNDSIVEITSECGQYNQDDWYRVDCLADGTPAHHYMYIG